MSHFLIFELFCRYTRLILTLFEKEDSKTARTAVAGDGAAGEGLINLLKGGKLQNQGSYLLDNVARDI